MDDITRIQRYFARKAQAQPTYRFRDLYSLVWKPSFLRGSTESCTCQPGQPVSWHRRRHLREFKDPGYRASFIQTLSQELKDKTFIPLPGRRNLHSQRRTARSVPLGILTIKDRVVQMVLKMLLEPIFEADFLDCSYGFRPGRRTMDCLVPIWRHVNQQQQTLLGGGGRHPSLLRLRATTHPGGLAAQTNSRRRRPATHRSLPQGRRYGRTAFSAY